MHISHVVLYVCSLRGRFIVEQLKWNQNFPYYHFFCFNFMVVYELVNFIATFCQQTICSYLVDSVNLENCLCFPFIFLI